MLIVSRKENEVIEIRPDENCAEKTLGEAFADGTIQISFLGWGNKRVKVAIDAPREMKIRRGEPTSA